MASYPPAITLVVFGLILTLVGGFLQMLCLFSGGLICSGTMIGDFAITFLLLGVPLLVVGLALWPLVNKSQPRRKGVLHSAPAATTRAGRPAGRARSASECPKCGGPVKPSEDTCEWCGAPLV